MLHVCIGQVRKGPFDKVTKGQGRETVSEFWGLSCGNQGLVGEMRDECEKKNKLCRDHLVATLPLLTHLPPS